MLVIFLLRLLLLCSLPTLPWFVSSGYSGLGVSETAEAAEGIGGASLLRKNRAADLPVERDAEGERNDNGV